MSLRKQKQESHLNCQCLIKCQCRSPEENQRPLNPLLKSNQSSYVCRKKKRLHVILHLFSFQTLGPSSYRWINMWCTDQYLSWEVMTSWTSPTSEQFAKPRHALRLAVCEDEVCPPAGLLPPMELRFGEWHLPGKSIVSHRCSYK